MTGAALDLIAAEADTIGAEAPPEGQGAPQGAGPQAVPQSPNLGPIAFMLATFRTVSCLMLKVESPKDTLNDANCQACAEVLAPVADKYGLDLRQMMSGSVEATAVMVAGPILWTAASELMTELKARRAKPVPAEDAPPAAPPASDAD